jgi:hypothetical protein
MSDSAVQRQLHREGMASKGHGGIVPDHDFGNLEPNAIRPDRFDVCQWDAHIAMPPEVTVFRDEVSDLARTVDRKTIDVSYGVVIATCYFTRASNLYGVFW